MDQKVSRRTVAKGVAWAVPTVMVAGAAPAYAVSPFPPDPSFDWANGCATTGSVSGCANAKKTAQVPFTAKNTTAQELQLQITGVKSWNSNQSKPGSFAAAGGIYTNNGTENNCDPKLGVPGCGRHPSVTIPAGATLSLWLVGSELGNSSAFWMEVKYQWVTPDCTTVIVPEEIAAAPFIVPDNNCS